MMPIILVISLKFLALQTLPEHSGNRVRAQKAIALARVGVTLHGKPPAHYVARAIYPILTEEQR